MSFDFFQKKSTICDIPAREGVLIYLLNYIMNRLGNYFRDTFAEMKHVSWPTQSQALVYTALVIGISALVALIVSGFDFVFTSLLDLVV